MLFFSSRRRHTRYWRDWSSDVCSSDLFLQQVTGTKLKLQGGSPVALNWAIDGVRKGGTVSVVGAYGPIPNAVKFGDALNKGLTLRMNQTPVKRQWPRMFEHVRNGHLTPDRKSVV